MDIIKLESLISVLGRMNQRLRLLECCYYEDRKPTKKEIHENENTIRELEKEISKIQGIIWGQK